MGFANLGQPVVHAGGGGHGRCQLGHREGDEEKDEDIDNPSIIEDVVSGRLTKG